MSQALVHWISGPVLRAATTDAFALRESVRVGPDRLLGEVVRIDSGEITVQVYEDTTEGTPISPVLASKEDVVAWLVREAIRPEDAAAFVEIGSVPTKVTFADGTQLRGFATAALILKGRRRQTGAAS